MRALGSVALLATATLAGCSGFSIGVRQDKDDRVAVTRVLRAKVVGDRFAARELLGRDWTRLWVFAGGVETRAIEDRIAIPFPESGEATPPETPYLVFDDGKAVVAAFSLAGRDDDARVARVRAGCLLAQRGPLAPATPLVVVASRPSRAPRVVPVASVARCR